MLQDTRIQDSLCAKHEEKTNSNGLRVYREFHTGEQFREICRRAPAGATPLALSFYMDETWLSQNGKASCKPLVMSIANVHRDVFNQDWSKKIVLHFVDLGGSSKTKNTNNYRAVSAC